MNAGLLAYFLVSYSVGLASLVVSLASWLKRRTQASRDFLLVGLVMAIIGASTLLMNLFDRAVVPLELVNHAGAAVFIFVLPLLVHSVYKPAHARALNIGFLTLACLAAAAAVVITLSGFPDESDKVLLGAKDLVILYGIVRILQYRSRRHDGEMENVLHYIGIGSAIIYPIIAGSELAPAAFQALVPLDPKGSLSLPLAYLIWSAAYLLSWFRGYIRPLDASEDSYRDFSARFGLSPRETDVVRLLLSGQSYKEIMASLSISMPTVKSHVGSIYRKTSCNNKMQFSLLFSSAAHPKV